MERGAWQSKERGAWSVERGAACQGEQGGHRRSIGVVECWSVEQGERSGCYGRLCGDSVYRGIGILPMQGGRQWSDGDLEGWKPEGVDH